MLKELKIGAVAKAAGVTVDAVRFYERRGILPAPQRRASGYRIYRETAVERIQFVKQLQTLGFSLDDILEVLGMLDSGAATCSNQQPRFAAVLQRIDDEMSALQATRNKISEVIERCQAGQCSLDPRVNS